LVIPKDSILLFHHLQSNWRIYEFQQSGGKFCPPRLFSRLISDSHSSILSMSSEIIPSSDFVESITEEYESIDIPVYKLRAWYSTEEKIFFDCDREDLRSCLVNILEETTYSFFRVFFLVRDTKSKNVEFMDVRYSNIRKETLEDFVERYDSQLKPGGLMSLEAQGREYLRYLGASYEE